LTLVIHVDFYTAL